MSYTGTKIELPLGKQGVRTDDPNADLSLGELFRAVNTDFYAGMIQKAPGSKKWSTLVATGGAILAGYDWEPLDGIHRVTVGCADGHLYQFKNNTRITQMVVDTGAPPKLTPVGQPHFVTCGENTSAINRKLVFFSGSDMPQVVDGNTIIRRNITKPASEWVAGNFPSFGIVFRNHLWTLGTKGAPHRVIASTAADHEDFTTLADVITQDVFPGEGDYLTTAWVFRGKLFVAKFPRGVYVLNDSSTTSSQWYFEKVADTYGSISAHGTTEVVDDLLVANQFGTLTAMSAAFQLGNVKFADLIANLRVEQMVRSETRPTLAISRWSLFYPDKKLALFTYRSTQGSVTDKFVCIDFTNQKPKAYMLDKDKPLCLFLVKDMDGQARPVYGGTDGFLYQMDDVNRLVGTNGYGCEFRIPYTDFGMETNKMFDFLEVECEHAGLWNLYCDVHIDDDYSETITYLMASPPVLRPTGDSNCFQLDHSRLLGRQTRSFRKQLHGRGRNIAFRFYMNDTTGQNFKITKCIVYTRLGNEDKKS